MTVEWQGDHKMLGDGVKQGFERELKRLRLDSSDFIVEVRRQPTPSGARGTEATRYDVFVTELGRTDRDTLKLEGGEGEDWIRQLEARLKHRG